MNANNANVENAVEPNTEDTSPLCPPCSDVKGRRPKTGRPLSRMECLSDRQLMHINAWLDDGEPFKKLVDLCKSNFEVEIPKTTFQRYYKRSAARTLIADLADSKEAAAEISKYAVTGVALFSTTTLEILEQQAFDLAVAFQRDADAEDLGNLKNLWTLIHKAKNTNIRERHAAVQEQKIQLRREELALKRELALAHLNSKNCGGTRSPSPTSISRDASTNNDAAAPLNTDLLITDHSPSSSSAPSTPSALKSEPMENIDRHSALLLAGKIKTHYKHDPENSLLAKYLAFTAPEVLVESERLARLSDDEIQAYIAQHNIDITPVGDPDYHRGSQTNQFNQTNQPTEKLTT